MNIDFALRIAAALLLHLYAYKTVVSPDRSERLAWACAAAWVAAWLIK
jgi:hypothetical protein